MEILQDPDRIQQITEMASAMGLNESIDNAQTVQPAYQEALQHVSRVLHQTEAKDQRQQTLMRALLPYLSPRRQAKLEQAMKISHLSRLASVALQSDPLSPSLTEEGEFRV